MHSKLAIWFLIVGLIASASTDSEECEDKAEKCLARLLNTILGEVKEDEVCTELYGVSSCLKELAKDCVDDEDREEAFDSLKELDKLLKKNCEEGEEQELSDDEETIAKCVEENAEYMTSCVGEAIETVKDHVDQLKSEDTIMCSMYAMAAECFVQRANEKCGEIAAEFAKDEMDDVPAEVKEACENATPVEVFTTQLLNDLKKKRKK